MPRARAISSASPWERAWEKSKASRMDCRVVATGAALTAALAAFLAGGAAAAARLLPKRDFLAGGAGGLWRGGGGRAGRERCERRGRARETATPRRVSASPPRVDSHRPLRQRAGLRFRVGLPIPSRHTPCRAEDDRGQGRAMWRPAGAGGPGGERRTRRARVPASKQKPLPLSLSLPQKLTLPPSCGRRTRMPGSGRGGWSWRRAWFVFRERVSRGVSECSVVWESAERGQEVRHSRVRPIVSLQCVPLFPARHRGALFAL